MSINTSPVLSVVIVSYNAKAFLELCLWSVQRAMKGAEVEVLLIDNASVDGTLDMVSDKFDFVTIVPNTTNLGFGRANNKALAHAQGRWVLLLNPDTIIPEDTFDQLLQHFHLFPNSGGLGVKMIDGAGRFLPESKRGLPTLWRSFGRLSALSRFFPNNHVLSGYYANEVQELELRAVDVLSGAFMAFPKEGQHGLNAFNERFFMYGEDIELSFCLQQKYGNNYYNGLLSIIHFKGESTPLSKKMIYHFYDAMWIFYDLHLKKSHNTLTSLVVKMAVKTIICFAGLLLPYRQWSERRKKKLSLDISKVLVCTNTIFDTHGLKKHYGDCEIIQIKSDDLDSFVSDGADYHVLFDLQSISAKEVITVIDTFKSRFVFGFISPQSDFVLFSSGGNYKGRVLYF